MVNVQLATLLEIFDNYKNIINKRFYGNQEFDLFINFLKIYKWLLMVMYICLISFIVFFIFTTYHLKNYKEIIYGLTLLVTLLIVFIIKLHQLISMNYKYFRYKYKYPKGIKTKGWEFKEYIFNKPIQLNDKKQISFKIKNQSKFALYLIVQYHTGHFKFYNITNNRDLKNSRNEKVKIYDGNPIKHEDIKKKIKLYLWNQILSPQVIVGLRIRGNIANETNEIQKLDFNQKINSH